MKDSLTDITVILDRSGSMERIRHYVNSGFDEFIAKQRAIPGDVCVSLVQFDDKYEPVYAGRTLDAVPPLHLEPRGMTALNDAIGRTINDTGARLRALPEADRPGKVLFLIITDGAENASKEFSREKVKDMIEHQTKTYSWDFVYLGANQDAIKTAAGYGISGVKAASFGANLAGATASFSAAASYTTATRGAQVGENVKLVIDSASRAALNNSVINPS